MWQYSSGFSKCQCYAWYAKWIRPVVKNVASNLRMTPERKQALKVHLISEDLIVCALGGMKM